MARTREPQYERCLEVSEQSGRTRLGLMSNQVWHDDPRRRPGAKLAARTRTGTTAGAQRAA